MYVVAMLLTTCIGTWMALRRHPLYSGHAAFRIAAETLLFIAAGAGVIVFAAWLASARSAAVLLASILGAVAVVTLGMTYVITAITTPRSARLDTRLPPTVTPVNWHRRVVYRWARRALAVFGLVALVVLFAGSARAVVGVLALTTVVPAAIAFPAWYLRARQLDRAVTALQLNPWLHWHYSPEARAAWIDVRRERLRAAPTPKLDWRMAGGVCFPVMLVGAILIVDGPWLIRAAWGLGFCTLVFGVIEIAQLAARREPDREMQRMRTAAPDAYFGQDGVLSDDRFLPWLAVNQYLIRASVDERPPRCVALVFKKIMAGGYAGPHTVTVRQDVLIPVGANEADLRLLQSALSSRCPSAQVQLVS